MKNFDPDDPMLTAYALGELEGEELRECEELVARDPAAARHVESIRAAAGEFGEAFSREPAPSVEPIRAVEVEPEPRARTVPFLFYLSTAVAACFFVVIALRLGNPVAENAGKGRAAEAQLPAGPPSEKAAATSTPADAGLPRQKELRDQVALDAYSPARSEKQEASVAQQSNAPQLETFDSLQRAKTREDKDKVVTANLASSSPGPAPQAAVGELKGFEKKSAESGSAEPTSISAFAAIAKTVPGIGTVEALRQAVERHRPVAGIDVSALLADLDFGETKPSAVDSELGNTLAQTTGNASPQPDPEAALARAVERFAQLLARHIPANDESWDRALADARYAAGDDAKRREFVLARKQAAAPDAH